MQKRVAVYNKLESTQRLTGLVTVNNDVLKLLVDELTPFLAQAKLEYEVSRLQASLDHVLAEIAEVSTKKEAVQAKLPKVLLMRVFCSVRVSDELASLSCELNKLKKQSENIMSQLEQKLLAREDKRQLLLTWFPRVRGLLDEAIPDVHGTMDCGVSPPLD